MNPKKKRNVRSICSASTKSEGEERKVLFPTAFSCTKKHSPMIIADEPTQDVEKLTSSKNGTYEKKNEG